MVANSEGNVVNAKDMQEPLFGLIDDSSSTAEQTTGGVLSATTRLRDEEGRSLLLPMGDKRWMLNSEVIGKEELKSLVQELLDVW